MSRKGGSSVGRSEGNTSANSSNKLVNSCGTGSGGVFVTGVEISAQTNSVSRSCASKAAFGSVRRVEPVVLVGVVVFVVVVAEDSSEFVCSGDGRRVIVRPLNAKLYVLCLPRWVASLSNCHGRPRRRWHASMGNTSQQTVSR